LRQNGRRSKRNVKPRESWNKSGRLNASERPNRKRHESRSRSSGQKPRDANESESLWNRLRDRPNNKRLNASGKRPLGRRSSNE
jgi:hypothetical protein